MLTINSHVREEDGALRVGEADISLESVVLAFRDGFSPEAIQCQFPVLTLPEIYGAIAYYLENRTEVDRYLQSQARLWDDLQHEYEQDVPDVVQRLRSRHP